MYHKRKTYFYSIFNLCIFLFFTAICQSLDEVVDNIFGMIAEIMKFLSQLQGILASTEEIFLTLWASRCRFAAKMPENMPDNIFPADLFMHLLYGPDLLTKYKKMNVFSEDGVKYEEKYFESLLHKLLNMFSVYVFMYNIYGHMFEMKL